jgi:hypothetical protein
VDVYYGGICQGQMKGRGTMRKAGSKRKERERKVRNVFYYNLSRRKQEIYLASSEEEG